MKTLIFTLLCLLALILSANAQVLYGTASDGGKYYGGSICAYNTATHTLKAVKSFYVDGSSPYGNLTLASDGKLYGTTIRGGRYGSGGRSGLGTIFSYNAATGTYTQVAAFDGVTNGGGPVGGLLQASDGKLYGMTGDGGNNRGEIFSFDPGISSLAKLYEFDITNDGGDPYGSLIQASDGKLYGMTSNGGSNSKGTMFSFDPITGTFTKLHDFDGTTGAVPYGNLMQAADGKLYGMTSSGGSSNYGVIFSFDPTVSAYTKLYDFDGTNGANPQKSLIQGADGNLYGMTKKGGKNRFGVIFSFNPSSLSYTKLYDFNGANGSRPVGNLFQATDGNLYGMTEWGGVNGYGVIFSFNPLNSTYTKLFDFDIINGAHPVSSFVQYPNGKLYAVAADGGALSEGIIFSYDIQAATYSKVRDFGYNQDGNAPYGALCKASDNNLYGMTHEGGNSNAGVIFSYNPSTDAFVKLVDFNDENGALPMGSLMQASDGKLYGMTPNGGKGYGVIFSYNPPTSTYTKLYDFDGINGSAPWGSLVQASDGKLYGMTREGGNKNYGVIFSFDPETLNLTRLFDFDSKNGGYPTGGLMQASDGKLYGMAGARGKNFGGVIFSVDISTSAFTKLYDFDNTDGANPQGSLIQASDGKLYGMTVSGGTKIENNYFNGGVIFSFDPASSTYKKLYDFDGINGSAPWGSLLQASDGKLYGMTYKGGTNDYGVAFSYDIAADSSNYKKLSDFTLDIGEKPYLTSFVEIPCTPKTYYKDADGDGFGNPDSTIQSCAKHKGYVRDSTDCNDADAAIHPGAPELCDGKDNNCDGQVDENCPIAKISISDASAFEGNSGYTKMHFRVKLSMASNNIVKVHYSTVRSTATAQVDYVPTKGTLTFTPGQQRQIITVLIKGDQQVELSELFKVQLSKPVGAVIGDGEGIGIIIDDDLNISGTPIIGESMSTNPSVVVTPNPATNVVNVQLSGFKGNTVLQLLSPAGRLLKEIKLQLKSMANQQLNVSDLPGGTYFLIAKDEKGDKQTVKLVIAR